MRQWAYRSIRRQVRGENALRDWVRRVVRRVLKLGGEHIGAGVEIEGVDESPPNEGALINNLERDHVRVENDRRRVAKKGLERDPVRDTRMSK